MTTTQTFVSHGNGTPSQLKKRVHRAKPKASADTPTQTMSEKLWADYHSAREALFGHLKMPSWARVATAFIVGLVAAVGIGYLASLATELIMLAAITLTGNATFAMILWCIGLVLSVYACMKTSSFITDYIESKKIDEHWTALKAKLGFTSKP